MSNDDCFSGVSGLGQIKSQHRRTASDLTLFVVLGAGSVFTAMYLAVSYGWGGKSWFGITFLAVLGASFLYFAWDNLGYAIALFEGGIAVSDRRGLHAVRWEDVAEVWQSIVKRYVNGQYRGTSHRYTLRTKDGKRLKLKGELSGVGEISGIGGLGQAVQANVTRILLPQYAQALASGQRIKFGPVSLDLNGIYYDGLFGNKSLARAQIGGFSLERGSLAIKQKEARLDWASVPVSRIPNFFILCLLLERALKR